MTTPIWRVRVLGDVMVERLVDGNMSTVQRSQARLIVSLLAFSDAHRLSSEVLIDALWPDRADVDRGTLRVAINRARAQFDQDGPHVIVRSGDGYGFSDQVVVDKDEWLVAMSRGSDETLPAEERVDAFEMASDLWRSEPVAPDVRGWDVRSRVAALEVRRAAAALQELDLLSLVDPVRAAHRAPSLVDVAPLHEALVVKAMDALGGVGNAAAALAVARLFRERLRDELGLVPSDDLVDAERRWLAPRASAAGRERRPPEGDGSNRPPGAVSDRSLDTITTASEALEAALVAQSGGRREHASSLFSRAVSLADPATEGDVLVAAALGGSAHAATIGGDIERRNRIRLAVRRLPDHPRRDELIADLVLETANCRMPVGDELRDDIDRICTTSTSPGHVLALRWRLADRQIGGDTSVDDAVLLVERMHARAVDVHHTSAALAVAVTVATAHGALDLAEEWAAEFEALGVRTGQPRAQWQSTVFRSVLAEMRGRHDMADDLAARALTTGNAAGMADADATFGLHMVGRAWRSGSLASFAPVFAAAADRYRFPVWTMFQAAAELDAGNDGRAKGLLIDGLDEVLGQRDHFAAAAQALASHVAARLGATDACAALADALGSRRDRFVVVGYGGPCLGPVASFLCRLEVAQGRADTAADRAAEAIEVCRSSGAFAWLDVCKDALR
jgi:DNA-binding SARP family transcriptional activator